MPKKKKTPDETPTPPPRAGRTTAVLKATEAAEHRAQARAEKAAKALEKRDARQDERTDNAWQMALDQANRRASDAEKALASKDKNITRAAIFMGIQMLVILALAGHEVYMQVDKSGNVTVEVDNAEAPKTEEAKEEPELDELDEPTTP